MGYISGSNLRVWIVRYSVNRWRSHMTIFRQLSNNSFLLILSLILPFLIYISMDKGFSEISIGFFSAQVLIMLLLVVKKS